MFKQGNDPEPHSIESGKNEELVNKIENAYKVFKMSEMYLNDVSDDYGKKKIARLRYEFAQHELMKLLQEASKEGINHCCQIWNFPSSL